MRIGIDLRWLQRAYLNSPEGALGGAGIVIRNLWRGLSETASGHQLVALLNRGVRPAPLAELLQGAEAHAIGVHGLVPPLDRKWKYLNACNWLETDFGLGLTLRSLRLDVLHMTDHVPPPRFAGCPTVSTLHEYFTEVRRGWPLYRYLCDGKIGRAHV